MFAERFPCLTFGEWFDALALCSSFGVCSHARFLPFFSLSTRTRFCAGRMSPIRGFIPEAESSEEGVGVVALSATWREFFQFLGVTAPNNHVVGVEGVDQSGHSECHVVAPFLLSQSLQAAEADVVFECPLLVRQVAQFHRYDDALNNERGTKAGPQTKKQQSSILIPP